MPCTAHSDRAHTDCGIDHTSQASLYAPYLQAVVSDAEGAHAHEPSAMPGVFAHPSIAAVSHRNAVRYHALTRTSVLNPNNTSAAPPTAGATTTVPAFTGASSASDVPFTSGVSASTTVTAVPTRDPEATSTSTAGAAPMQTGMIGLGALFGGAALVMGNL